MMSKLKDNPVTHTILRSQGYGLGQQNRSSSRTTGLFTANGLTFEIQYVFGHADLI
jgi:hypothetical protein